MPTWKSLGVVQASLLQWQQFELSTSSTTFRITFLDLPENYWSYIRIRQDFSMHEVSPSQRIYPKREQQIIVEIKLPDELYQSGIYSRFLSVARFKKYRKWINDRDYSVQIEELV